MRRAPERSGPAVGECGERGRPGPRKLVRLLQAICQGEPSETLANRATQTCRGVFCARCKRREAMSESDKCFFRRVTLLVASPQTVIIHFESIRNLGGSVQAPICLRPRAPSRSKLTTLARRVLVRTMMAPHRAARLRLACLSVASRFPARRHVSYRFPLCPSTRSAFLKQTCSRTYTVKNNNPRSFNCTVPSGTASYARSRLTANERSV